MHSKILPFAALLLLAPGLVAAAESPGVVKTELIYTEASFPSCHASTLAETSDGTLVAAWFGGTAEGNQDVGIWFSRREQEGWTKPVEVASGIVSEKERHPTWNPVLFQLEKGPLVLFYKVGPKPNAWWGMRIESADGGKTWSKPERLAEGILGPIKNKPIALADGTLLSPSSTEHDGWRVHFERSTDGGKTWTKTEPINDGKAIGAIQPTILRRGDELLALGRSRQRKIWEATSRDGGKTWSEMKLTALPNPNSGIDAVTLADGRHLLIYNHTLIGRTPLNLAISQDGRDWKAAAVLETDFGEYSYPAIIQTKDGRVHASYTWKRQRVKHVEIEPAKLAPREFLLTWP